MKKKKELLVEALRDQSSILFAYLFGSKAKGYANQRSDWDLAVYLTGPAKKNERWPAFKIEAELSRVLGEEVQIILLNNPLPPLLGFEIVKRSILLLDRNKDLRIDFENRVLRNYYDWQYFLERHIKSVSP